MSNANQSIKRIPYGLSDYAQLREEYSYYVDKTHFIPLIEAAPLYLFCLRPRRSGKSLWLSVLQHYYDINLADQFEALFGDTYIGQNPTPRRNSYLILFLNFSMVDSRLDRVQSSFENNTNNEINDFLTRYAQFFDEEAVAYIQSGEDIPTRLQRIFYHAKHKKLRVYFLIDEYDNFTNTILANEGQQAYHEMTHGSGFFRYFFNLLKGLTGGQISGLGRLFITGVSPVTMDDVTSGFNIGTNISLESEFNEFIGFTEEEVRTMLRYYYERGWTQLPLEEAMSIMKSWYDNYYFSDEAETPMFNSDMTKIFVSTMVNCAT